MIRISKNSRSHCLLKVDLCRFSWRQTNFFQFSSSLQPKKIRYIKLRKFLVVERRKIGGILSRSNLNEIKLPLLPFTCLHQYSQSEYPRPQQRETNKAIFQRKLHRGGNSETAGNIVICHQMPLLHLQLTHIYTNGRQTGNRKVTNSVGFFQ